MRLSSEIIGKQILSLSDGSRLGTVRDLYLDNNVRAITAVHVGYNDLFGGRAGLIERGKISTFGIDAVLAADSQISMVARGVEPPLPDGKHWLLNEQLLGREVQTVNGQPLGTMVDLILSDGELEIVGFVVGTQELVDGATLITPRAEIVLEDLRAQAIAIRVRRPFPLILLDAN